MIRTVFHKTADDRFVEVSALTGSAFRILQRKELPLDVRTSTLHIGEYYANCMAKEHDTYCTGETLESAFMRDLNNNFVNPELL